MEVVVLGPPMVYGPGVKGNLADAIRACITRPKATGKAFLVSDGDDVSIPELIRRVAKALERRSFLLPVPVSLLKWAGAFLSKKEVFDRPYGSFYVDMTPIREDLGWNPPYTIQAGLTATARWYRNTRASA
jgi:nucleoside-diphosphate-sugar epimerase